MSLAKIRYFYRTEGKRRVTVAYRYDPETGRTSYGATIFRQDFPNETYIKRSHRNTAENRLRESAIALDLSAGLKYAEVEDHIRQAMVDLGVKSGSTNRKSSRRPTSGLESATRKTESEETLNLESIPELRKLYDLLFP